MRSHRIPCWFIPAFLLAALAAPSRGAEAPSGSAGLPAILRAKADKDALKQQVRELDGLEKEAERGAPNIGLGYKVKTLFAGGLQVRDLDVLLAHPAFDDGKSVMVEGVLLPGKPTTLYPLTADPKAKGTFSLSLVIPPGVTPPTLDAEALSVVGGVIPVSVAGRFAVPPMGPPVLNVVAVVPGLTNQAGAPQSGFTLSPGLFAFRTGLLYDVNGDYTDAIAAYQAFGEKFRQHELAAQAYYRAAVLTETKLHDEKRAAKYYSKDLWNTYVQLNAKTPRTYYVWRPIEEGTEYERVPVKRAIGRHMDELNSKSQLYQVMALFVHICGDKAWAGLLLLAVVTRLALYPLTKKQMVSAKRMQELQPELKALQEKYKDDRQLLTRKMMAFYKERGVSPWGGCLPLLIQMPILIALYSGVRLYIYQFSLQGFLWVHDLSDPDLFLLVLYTISMIVFQKMTTKATPATDPQQEQMQKTMSYMMPVLFFFMFRNLPAAFILYWLGTNIIYSAQQFYINRLTPATAKPGRVATMTPARQSKANPGAAEEDEEEQAEEPETPPLATEQLKKRRRRRRRRKPGTPVEQRPEPVAQSENEE